jgi:hypothetical protein
MFADRELLPVLPNVIDWIGSLRPLGGEAGDTSTPAQTAGISPPIGFVLQKQGLVGRPGDLAITCGA